MTPPLFTGSHEIESKQPGSKLSPRSQCITLCLFHLFQAEGDRRRGDPARDEEGAAPAPTAAAKEGIVAHGVILEGLQSENLVNEVGHSFAM